MTEIKGEITVIRADNKKHSEYLAPSGKITWDYIKTARARVKQEMQKLAKTIRFQDFVNQKTYFAKLKSDGKYHWKALNSIQEAIPKEF